MLCHVFVYNKAACMPAQSGERTCCRGNELDVDEEYDHDGGLAMYESRNKKGTREKQVQRQKAAQVADYRCASSGPSRPHLAFQQ